MRYYLELKTDAKANDAVGDILILESLSQGIYARFKKDGNENPTKEMICISNSPIRIALIPFGKHKGQLFSEIPADYLEWQLSTDLDEDIGYALHHQIGISVSNI